MSEVYAYLVVDRAGKRMRGEIEADTEDRAAEQLRQRGDTVVELAPVGAVSRKLRLEVRTILSDAQLAEFATELRGLMLAGASLTRALTIMAESAGSRTAASLARDLRLQLELGNAASEALARARTSGLRLFGRFLAAAEQGGRHETMLQIAASFLGRRAAALQRMRSALAYPAFLLIAGLVAVAFLVIQVAPALAPLFEDSPPPPFLEAAAAAGQWIQDNMRLALLILAVVAALAFLAFRQQSFRSMLWQGISWAPGIRRIAMGLEFGPAVMAFAALLRSGWPAERALRLTADISEGRARAAFRSVAIRLRDGATLAGAFRSEDGLPAEIVHAIEIGEATGAAGDALDRVSEHLISRSLRALDRLGAVLGPVLIAVIGGLVAMVMISLLSSIGSLGDAVA